MKQAAGNIWPPAENNMFQYQINPDSETPIYRQLVEQINAQIRSGALKHGTQLPTVREMAERLHLSCGTVKHVYDCLQEMGDIEMTRRRGTFVKYVRKETDSRKQQAMHAIDHMIRKLMDLNFSPSEIQIFLNLKMREWGLRWSGIRIAVVTEYTELTSLFEKQLQQIGNVHVTVCPVSQLREYPYIIDEQSDVILTSLQDSQTLSYLLPDSAKVIRVAMQPDAQSLLSLASCPEGNIGVWCEHEAFSDLIRSYLPESRKGDVIPLTGNAPDLSGVHSLIVPEGFAENALRGHPAQFETSLPVHTFSYRLDEGSMLYLEERITKIRDERQQWPGALRL